MPLFKDYIAGRTAEASIVDADEFYVRDDSGDTDKRITYAGLKTALDVRYAPYSRIEQIVTTAGQQYVTFADIPQNFDALEIHWAAVSASASGLVQAQFNADTAGNYDQIIAYRRTTSADVGGSASEAQTSAFAAVCSTAGASGVIRIPAYSNTVVKKLMLADWVEFGTSTPYMTTRSCANGWRSTSAITQVQLDANFSGRFAAGCVFTLLGVGGSHPS